MISRRPFGPTRLTLIITAATTAVLAAGCDLRDPVSAPTPAPAPPSLAEAESEVLGSASTPIKVASRLSEATTYLPQRPAGLPPLAPNSYALIRISGRTRLVSGPWWPGPKQEIATYTAVETTEATGRAQTTV